MDALPEGQAHGAKDDEILASEHDTIENALLHALVERILQVRVVLGHHPRPKAEGLDGPDASEDVLGIGGGLRVDLEDLGLEHGVHGADDAEHDEESRDHPDEDQGQFPLRDEGDDERRQEGGDGLDDDAELLCDAGLDELAVGRGLLGDGAGEALVVIGDFLAEGGSQVVSSEVAGQVVRDVGEEGGVDVAADETDDADVDEVEALAFTWLAYVCVCTTGWLCL